ncbi:MAG: hypothetical protein R3339_06075, partial [Thermodesulfobacteriota bacterium]|nr:hypothetical protein [Thermodesulfobacteriota bacterium]
MCFKTGCVRSIAILIIIEVALALTEITTTIAGWRISIFLIHAADSWIPGRSAPPIPSTNLSGC